MIFRKQIKAFKTYNSLFVVKYFLQGILNLSANTKFNSLDIINYQRSILFKKCIYKEYHLIIAKGNFKYFYTSAIILDHRSFCLSFLIVRTIYIILDFDFHTFSSIFYNLMLYLAKSNKIAKTLSTVRSS